MQRYMLGVVLFLSGGTIQGYIEEYDRLFHRKTGVIIDILHDAHACQRHLSCGDILKRAFSFVKSRLYKTEGRLLEVLHAIETHDPQRVELVWEVGRDMNPGTSQFLAHGHRLVRDTFRKLSFVAADIARDAFEDILLMRPTRRPRDMNYSIDGTSIARPVPLPAARAFAIKKNYGEVGWRTFDEYFTQISQNATNQYKKGFMSGKRFSRHAFNEVACFDALCDIELLSHILASKKKQVIVYCGGWHADNLIDFLVDKMGFRIRHEVYRHGKELEPEDLDLIMSYSRLEQPPA